MLYFEPIYVMLNKLLFYSYVRKKTKRSENNEYNKVNKQLKMKRKIIKKMKEKCRRE